MTIRNFTPILDAQTDPLSPVNAELVQSLHRNLAATMQGDASVTADERGRIELFTRLVQGSDVAFLDEETRSTTSSSFTEFLQWGFAQSGTITASVEFRPLSASGSVEIVQIRDGVETVLLQETSTSPSFTTYSENVTLEVGDFLSFRFRDNASGTSEARNVTFGVNGTQLLPFSVDVRWRNVAL